MKPYVKAGRLFRFLGWISVIGGVGGVVAAIAIPNILSLNASSLQPDAFSLLLALLNSLLQVLPTLILIVGISVLQLKVGTAIKEHKDWGRTVGIVLGIIHLFGFPIGTLIGAYILWCLIKGWGQ